MPAAPANLSFLPWVRQGVAAGVSRQDVFSAAQPGVATVDIALAVNHEPPFTVSAQLRGPADVAGIDPHQVIRMEPPPGSTSFEPNHFASVEFDRPDMPWLFTPLAAGDQARLRPWLCLVVVQRREGVALTPPGTGPLPQLVIAGPAAPAEELPDLGDPWAWSHAQAASGESTPEAVRATLNGGPELSLSRLICPRRLQPKTDYIACVVPTFDVGRKSGLGLPVTPDDLAEPKGLTPAWSLKPDAPVSVTVPVYHSWSFRTGEDGDFQSLARKLTPRPPPMRLGLCAVGVTQPGFLLTPPPTATITIDIPGALQPLNMPEPAPPLAADLAGPFQAGIAPIINAPGELRAADPDADPLLAPPLYGHWYAAKTTAAAPPTTGFDTLNLDPRWRAVAALGVRVVQEHQEALMASAWKQAADLREANQRVRQLQLSLAVGQNLHTRHLARLNPESAIAFAAPVFGRIQAPLSVDAAPQTLIGQISRTAVPMAAISVAMRRTARARGPTTRRAALAQRTDVRVMARVIDIGSIINVLNGGLLAVDPGVAPGPASGPATVGAIRSRMERPSAVRAYAEVTAEAISAVRQRTSFTVAPEGQPVAVATTFRPPRRPGRGPAPAPPQDTADAKAFRETAIAHLTRVNPGRPMIMVGPPVPLDTAGVHNTLLTHLDPRVTLPALAQALISIGPTASSPAAAQPRDSSALALDMVMAAPHFPQPMYEPLRDLSQDLMLPGLETVPPDTVLGLQTNRAFLEAYMVGLNGEMGGELLWRGFPTDQRGTYFDQFWDVRGVQDGRPDMGPLVNWGQDALGHSPRPGQSSDAESFVMLVRGALLQRYPNAIIYAARAKRTPQGRVVSEDVVDEVFPIFTGSMSPDVVFFGFPLPGDAVTGADGSEACYVVIQEHPTEPRFGLDAAAPPSPGGHVSALTDPPAGTALRGLAWGRNSADTAGIIRRLPVRVAIHGSRLLATGTQP